MTTTDQTDSQPTALELAQWLNAWARDFATSEHEKKKLIEAAAEIKRLLQIGLKVAAEADDLEGKNGMLKSRITSLEVEILNLRESKTQLIHALQELLDMPEPNGSFSMGKLRKSIKDEARAVIAQATVGNA